MSDGSLLDKSRRPARSAMTEEWLIVGLMLLAALVAFAGVAQAVANWGVG